MVELSKVNKGEKYKDSNKNGEYNPPKESYLGIISNQDIIYSVFIFFLRVICHQVSHDHPLKIEK